jgi:gamma-glutamyltranspeptidase/glutathione hydrolase
MPRTLGIAFLIVAVLGSSCRAPEPGSSAPDGVPAENDAVPPAAVAAGTPEAAEAGAEILRAGGNAMDAAVAIALSLAVTEPAGSGLGGTAYVLVHPPGGPAVAIRGPSRAPARIPDGVDAKKLRNHQATTVPSFLKVLEVAWRRHGSGRIAWAKLFEPAIRHAEDGFRLGPFRYRSLVRNRKILSTRPSAAAVFLLPGGKLPPPDHRLRQPALARTLRRLAEHGADDFYKGAIAEAIARDMAEHEGWITREDLASFPPPEEVPALHGTYRGRDVFALPPPSGGWVALQALNILELVPARELALDHVNRPIWMAEALRAAYRSRRRSPVPDQGDYTRAVDRRTRKKTAETLFRAIHPPGGGETTHFSLVDSTGLAVAVTQSINSYFGARVLAPELGFLYNNYMCEFTTRKKGHPFTLAPDALAYSSMGALIFARDGKPELVLGSPGGGRIISAVVQTASARLDGGCSVEAAVREPRMHYTARTEVLHVERFPPERWQVLSLQSRGFEVSIPVTTFRRDGLDSYFGGVNAVAWENGRWVGAADPRRDGAVRYCPPASRNGV